MVFAPRSGFWWLKTTSRVPGWCLECRRNVYGTSRFLVHIFGIWKNQNQANLSSRAALGLDFGLIFLKNDGSRSSDGVVEPSAALHSYLTLLWVDRNRKNTPGDTAEVIFGSGGLSFRYCNRDPLRWWNPLICWPQHVFCRDNTVEILSRKENIPS